MLENKFLAQLTSKVNCLEILLIKFMIYFQLIKRETAVYEKTQTFVCI